MYCYLRKNMAYLKREKMKKKEKSITFVAAEKGVFVHR